MPTNDIALVTGGNRGLGHGVCRHLLDEGFAVVLTARDAQKAEEAAEALRSDTGAGPDRLVAQQLDVGDTASVEAARDAVAEQFGRLDVLVNNAAIDYDTDQDVLRADLERVAATLHTNTLGPWRVAQAFAPLLREARSHGRIVNVSSSSGTPLAEMSAKAPGYSVSKTALNAVTVMLARKLEADGVLVNAVGPGWVRTDMGGAEADRSIEEGARSICFGATLPADGPTGAFFRDGERVDW